MMRNNFLHFRFRSFILKADAMSAQNEFSMALHYNRYHTCAEMLSID